MSDNPTPRKMRSMFGDVHDEVPGCEGICKPLHVAHQPPAPRLSEEEIQRVANEIYLRASVISPQQIAAILRTLNEEKKA